MLTLKNETGRVVTVYNKYLKKDIPIAKAVVISDQELRDDFCLKIQYFSIKNEQQEAVFDVSRDFRRRLSVEIYNDSHFPVITTVDVQDSQEVILKEDDTPLPFLAMFFKRATLKRISCQGGQKGETLFCNTSDKKRLLKLLRWELLFMIPITLLLIAAISALCWQWAGWGIVITGAVITLLVAFCSCWNIYYYVAAKRWRVEISSKHGIEQE